MTQVAIQPAHPATTEREKSLMDSISEALCEAGATYIDLALTRARLAEAEKELGEARGAEELAAEKISALTLEVEKRREDDAVMGACAEGLQAELVRANGRLLGVAVELERLMNGAVNLPKLPHEVNEHLARIRALALPAEKG